MSTVQIYRLLADAVLIVHFGIVLFVVGGLALIVVGNRYAWPWVNRLWFRLAHLAAIGFVAVQAWLGAVCPLTRLEAWLRDEAGASAYGTGFIEYWVGRALFYAAPAWVFTAAYTLFALAVIAVWWYFPPARRNS